MDSSLHSSCHNFEFGEVGGGAGGGLSFCQVRSWYVCCFACMLLGQGVAQLVECATEKPGTVLTWVQVAGAVRDFSPRVSFQCRLSHGVHAAPVCNSMHRHHLGAHKKSQTLAAISLLGHTEMLHAWLGAGNVALAAAVPYPGKATYHKGQWSTEKEKYNLIMLWASFCFRFLLWSCCTSIHQCLFLFFGVFTDAF